MKIKHLVTKSSRSAGSGSATSAMAQLLASHKDSFVTLRKGESVKGKITKLTPSEILVDVGAKTEAVVLEKDRNIVHTIFSIFKVGDIAEVNVLTPESDMGQPIVSLRRYLGNMAWGKLEKLISSKESIGVTISEVAKAGYVVTTSFGISGFLPQSHISFSQNKDISMGDKIFVTVLELNRKENKIIFSQKPAFTDEDFTKLTSKFKPEQKVTVTIVNVASFGLFVSLPVEGSDISLEGFIHISEVAWDKTAELGHLFTAGQKIEAVPIKFDAEAKKVQLSIKRLTKDPFEAVMVAYPVDKKITGTVSKVEESGISVDINEKIEGFIRKEKIPPTTTYTVGQQISVLVSEYDKRRKRVLLVPVLLKKTIGYR
jgi:ribosomal protein S1